MANNKQVKAQVALEFTVAFICTMLFLAATAQIFVWFSSNIVNRQRAYEKTRAASDKVILDFYNQSEHPLDININILNKR